MKVSIVSVWPGGFTVYPSKVLKLASNKARVFVWVHEVGVSGFCSGICVNTRICSIWQFQSKYERCWTLAQQFNRDGLVEGLVERLQKSVVYFTCESSKCVQVRYFVGRYEVSFSLSMVDLPTGLSTFDLACSPVQTSVHSCLLLTIMLPPRLRYCAAKIQDWQGDQSGNGRAEVSMLFYVNSGFQENGSVNPPLGEHSNHNDIQPATMDHILILLVVGEVEVVVDVATRTGWFTLVSGYLSSWLWYWNQHWWMKYFLYISFLDWTHDRRVE